MRRLPRPEFSVRDIIVSFGNGPRVDQLHDACESFEAAETEYDALLAAHVPQLLPTRPTHLSVENAANANWAYVEHLRAKSSGARSYYVALRQENQPCGMCRVRSSRVVDHHLPRSIYPAYAIQPSNLVPICSDCNERKSDVVPNQDKGQLLHPYFDHLDSDDWLEARVTEGPGRPVVFGVSDEHLPSPAIGHRLRLHREFFDVTARFSRDAGDFLAQHLQLLTTRLERYGPSRVSDYLFELSDSVRARGARPWIAAALAAWASDQIFCDGAWGEIESPI